MNVILSQSANILIQTTGESKSIKKWDTKRTASILSLMNSLPNTDSNYLGINGQNLHMFN